VLSRTLIARTLTAVALVLLVVNVASYELILSFKSGEHAYQLKPLECSVVRNKLFSAGFNYTVSGRISEAGRYTTLYTVESCGVAVSVRVFQPLGNHSEKAIVLIHDYMSSYRDILGLAIELVDHNYTVALPNLPARMREGVELFSPSIESSWIYISACIVKGVVALLDREYRARSIGLLGVGFGGVVALFASTYIERADYAVSIAGFGAYAESLRSASLINYYLKNPRDANECLDPVYSLKQIGKPVLIVIGSCDEVNPPNPLLLSELLENANVNLIFIPCTSRFSNTIPWESVYSYLEVLSGRKYPASRSEISVENRGYGIVVEGAGASNTVIYTKPLLPGFPWLKVEPSSSVVLSYFVVPGVYVVADAFTLRVYGIYVADFSFGFAASALLLAVAVFLARKSIACFVKQRGVTGIVHAGLLATLLSTTSYPGILALDRYHVSLNLVAEIYSCVFSLISWTTLTMLFIQPILFTLLFSRYSKLAYSLYVSLPLFLVFTTPIVLFAVGFKFPYTVLSVPTTPLLLIAACIGLDYFIKRRRT